MLRGSLWLSLLWIAVGLVPTMGSCGGGLEETCTVGETTRCRCDDGFTGARRCETGTGWSDCDCGSTGGDGDVDGDTDTDTDADEDACVRSCEGRECGSDGCGGRCPPGCGDGETCLPSTGQCSSCTPSCTNRHCGSDGCGGTCPPGCVAGEVCVELSGQCCAPTCEGRMCGPDGCGGTCPPGCGPGDVCDGSGQCGLCEPDCVGRMCGPDGCGDTCGPGCAPDDTCDEVTGLCGTCDVAGGTGCPAGMKCGLRWLAGGGVEAACVPAPAMPIGPGRECVYIEDAEGAQYDDCQLGTVCYTDRAWGRVCMVLCSEANATPCTNAYSIAGSPVDGLCSLSLGEPLTGLRLCVPHSTCSPLCQNCPVTGDVCYPGVDAADNTGTVCFPYSPPAGSCSYLNNCPMGTYCVPTSAGNQCVELCDLAGTSPCDYAGCTAGSCGVPTDSMGAPIYPEDLIGAGSGVGFCM